MEYQRINEKIFVRLDVGEEIIHELTKICEKEQVHAANISGIGFTDFVSLRVYNKEKNEFSFKTIKESMEITALNGNVIMADNGLFTHLHIMLADCEMNLKGGHLIKCVIAATGEILIEVLEHSLQRGESNEEKLGLIRFE